MRVLAIETSGRHGSIATLDGDADGAQVVGQTKLGPESRTAQALAPALRSLLAAADWSPDSVELVAVAVGPGSFTGLRIGVTTGKTFAYAVGAEIIGVNTLDALAWQAKEKSPLWAVMDAQRGQLFAACFGPGREAKPQIAREAKIFDVAQWIGELRPGERVTGPALPRLLPRLPTEIAPVSELLWQPAAEAVGQVGWHDYRAGRRDDLWKMVPHYYRPSAAEERLL